ncbi:hypothetical protein [Streptomyces californicus]|uniref:hypothetical protein n=1 Tax=Streptomyces californicus TaxID=67351 RepID=UPI0036906679
MTAYDAYLAARLLAASGRTDTDAVTTADMDAAADIAGADRPSSGHDRQAVRLALDTITQPWSL